VRRRGLIGGVAAPVVLLAAFVIAVDPGVAAASGPGKVTAYLGIDEPVGIAAGSDGALWFTDYGNNSIGRVTTAGAVTNYAGTGIDYPTDIAAGPDGALWFTNYQIGSIGRITTGGVVTNYTGTGIHNPDGITVGPDGALWFTNTTFNTVVRITTTVTPKLKSFTPKSGTVGTMVTITGKNLSGATTVSFNGISAAINSDTATQIVTQVPTGATSGPITVTTPAGIATSTSTFAVN